MKKFLFFLLITQFSFAQNYRFSYEYKFAPLKGKPDSLTTDNMNLDTDGAKSYFYAAYRSEYDSLKALNNVLPTQRRRNINNNYAVIKDLKSKTAAYQTEYMGTDLQIPENEPIKWTLTTEKASFGKWTTQKATADYKGRSWEAWFTPELPFSDGPYKFSGLPGLIVKLNDTHHEHNFELIEVKKMPKIIFQPFKNPKIITWEKYRALKPYFDMSDFVEYMNMTKAGAETKLQNGGSIFISSEMLQNGKAEAYLYRKLGAGKTRSSAEAANRARPDLSGAHFIFKKNSGNA